MKRTERPGLAALPGNPHPAAEVDAVAGIAAGTIVEPENETEIAAVLRYASAHGLAVIPRGGGTQLDLGAPPRRADIVLSLARFAGVIEHAPHDLTATVRCGTRLADLQQTLGAARQWLALDPPLDPAATIGGVIATNTSGPRRQRYGGVRDQIIGVRIALADGTVARGGGKVVKNVAGYDLPKLYTGSLGTLGVIVSASFRLYPIPSFTGSALIEAGELGPLCDLALTVMAQPVVPTILDLFPDTPGQPATLGVRFESAVEEAVSDQIDAVQRLAEAAGLHARVIHGDADTAWWRARDAWLADYPDDEGVETVALKASLLPSDVGAWVEDLTAAQPDFTGLIDLRWRANAGLGLVAVRLTGPSQAVPDWGVAIRRLRMATGARRGSLAVTNTPPALRGSVDPWGVANGLAIMRNLKARFDPTNTLNPGRFAGGI